MVRPLVRGLCLTGRVNLWKKYFAHKAKKEKTRQQLVPFSNGQIFCKLIYHKPILKLILHPRSGTLGTRNLQAAGRQLRNLTDAENVHEKSLAEALGVSMFDPPLFFSRGLGARVFVGRRKKAPRYAREKPLSPVVWRPISANLRLNLTPVSFSFYQSISSDNFLYSFHFRVSKHEIVDKND